MGKSDKTLRLRSFTKGRQRWEVVGLRHRPGLAKALEKELKESIGITHASANPKTGRVLVRYTEDVAADQIEALLLNNLRVIVKTLPQKALRKQARSAVSPPHPIRRLIKTAGLKWPQTFGAPLLSVTHNILSFLPQVFFAALVNTAQRRKNKTLEALGIKNTKLQISVLAAVAVLVILTKVLVAYIQKRVWRKLARTVEHEVRTQVYAHVQTLDVAFLEGQSTGRLIDLIYDDATELDRFFELGAESLIRKTTTILVMATLYFSISPLVAFASFLPLPFLLFASRYFQEHMAPFYTNILEHTSNLNQLLGNNLAGFATVKSYASEAREAVRIRESSDAVRQSNLVATDLSSAFAYFVEFVSAVSFSMVFIVGGFLALSGTITLASYLLMILVAPGFRWVLEGLADELDLYQRALAAARRSFALLDTRKEIVSGHQVLPAAYLGGEIVFEDVNFGYYPESSVLQDLQLHVGAGQTIAFVGTTGSGKSTIVKLIMRFYDVGRGSISIDGIDVRDIRTPDLRSIIGFVSQEAYLFQGTAYENIAYGRPEASQEEVEEAARVAEAHDFIMELPQGYATMLGERGQKLSGGQRQRISIARAVLKNSPILIFDEATSSVDNETELAIRNSLRRFGEGRTMIIIAHRLSTVRHADHIYVVEAGKICEQGTHEALLEYNGVYAAFWRLQAGGDGEQSRESSGPRT